ncbi:hypothetical protein RND81_06G140400 [Saponaria officinalis]|uniref:Wax synthase domain-containing protein n=1 Tax=Saponaria officinalis TaxID=3572 RepID=A0AAW1KAC7_SAPOF
MVELAENEIRNFVEVWLSICVSLTYCYIVGKITSKGFTRLLAILPIISLFFALPLKLTSIHLCGLTAFFISWLANFKLLLFAFGKPPLSFDPPLSFPYFLSVACLPIKIQIDPTRENTAKSRNKQDPDRKTTNKPSPSPENQQNIPKESPLISRPFKIQNDPTQKNLPELLNKRNPDHKNTNKSNPSPQNQQDIPKKSPWNFIIKGTLLAIIVKVYDYNNQIPEKLLWLLYGLHIYFALEIILACVAKSANFFLGIELEPQFNEPLLSTSLQDFWGRRWNLMVTIILRPTIYFPTLNLCTKFVGKETAKLVAVMATFVVSAFYHELIFYYLGRVTPTFQVTWFFLLHGFCLCVELAVKKYFGRKMRVPWWFSVVATVGFVVVTGLWLFMPPLLRAGLASKGLHEYAVVGAFVRRLIRV